MNTRVATVTLALLALSPAAAFAAAPTTVLIEGAMHSTGGGAAADGVYDATFRLWDKATAGVELHKEITKIQTINGRFNHVLGKAAAMDVAALVGKGVAFLGVQIGTDPEMSRAELHGVMFASWANTAGDVACKGCVGQEDIAAGSISGVNVGFNYANSDTKGGNALKANALACTGCVTVDHLKFDKDLDLGANALSAGKLTSGGDIVAKGSISAAKFLGDGSQLTGIKTPSGTCSVAGEVMKGIDGDGKPICVKALDAKNLPGDGLNEISSDTLSNHFSDTIVGGKGLDIPDEDSTGLLDIITVPSVGKADTFEVYVEISKEPFVDDNPKNGKADFDTRDLTVLLFPPTTNDLPEKRSNIVSNFLKKPTVDQGQFPHYILHSLGGDEGDLTIAATYPTKTTVVAGDIHKDWLGKDPVGKWRLLILDNSDRPSTTTDGKLVSWHIKFQTTSTNQVLVAGQQFINGKLYGSYNGHDTKQKGGDLGGTLQVGAAMQVGSSAAACTAGLDGAIRNVAGDQIELCKAGRWVALQPKLCPGADIHGVCLASTGDGNQDFRTSARYCAGINADMCTDSQTWVLDRSGMLDSTATWTNSFADNDSGQWSELNNGTGDDHSWGSGWQAPCCYNLTPWRKTEKNIKGVRLLHMHKSNRVYFRQAAMYCAGLGGDICSKAQMQVLRENASASGYNTGYGYWSSDHGDNDSAGWEKGIGPHISDNPTFGQHWSFACCASHRKNVDECPVARIDGVCAPIIVDENKWNWSQAANACASKELELCSISEVAVLRFKGKFNSTNGQATRVWTENYSDCDSCGQSSGCPHGYDCGAPNMPTSDSGPGKIAVGPIGDDHPPTTKGGYACCL